VVRRRREEPAASREEAALAIAALLRIVDQLEAAVALALVVGGEAGRLLVLQHESRVAHAQWLEDARTKIGVEPLPGDHLDQMADQIGGHGKGPGGAR